MQHTGIRALTGLVTVAVIAAIVVVAVGLFQGSFTTSAPVTVLSPRAGLVMNPDAKVEMRGVQVGRVDSIESRSNGQAVLHLAMNPSQMHLIPANVLVNVTAPTVFGAKFVDLVPPAEPSAQSLHAGQVLDSQHVTVEINTIFQRMTGVFDNIDPAKLNQTFGALARALSGKGQKIGQAFSDLDSFLAKLDPSLPALSRDIEASAQTFNAYGDASQDLVQTVRNSVKISKSIVDEQRNLDALLVSAIGLANIGNDVFSTNRQLLPAAVRLLVPTTDLTNEYSPALQCALTAMANASVSTPPFKEPGVYVNASLTAGAERYRYPTNLPKVAATGGPQCLELKGGAHPFNTTSPFLVTDDGANPFVYGNQQYLLNSDALKQLLYGPIAGPPRNTTQVGMPG
jgi:phospholipid/cholesterol/gamma-HCH transport system substrate-binding protein